MTDCTAAGTYPVRCDLAGCPAPAGATASSDQWGGFALGFADINGDGHLDAIVTSLLFTVGALVVFEGVGDVTFRPAYTVPSGLNVFGWPTFAVHFVIADIDLDGRLETSAFLRSGVVRGGRTSRVSSLITPVTILIRFRYAGVTPLALRAEGGPP